MPKKKRTNIIWHTCTPEGNKINYGEKYMQIKYIFTIDNDSAGAPAYHMHVSCIYLYMCLGLGTLG